jgi:uncharacterized protein (TIGR01777 family)
MKIAIAGSTGLIGSALVDRLRARGDDVVRLVRPVTRADGIPWDPALGVLDVAALEGFDAVINLAGRNIGTHRWNEEEKARVWESRVDSTRLLAGAIASLDRPPSILLNASAVGYYGDRGDTPLTEADGPGEGFLAELCVAWEGATVEAAEAGVRVACLRNGIVLSEDGGAVGRLLAPLGPRWISPFRWGLGGKVGNGKQVWSWISLQDEVRAILHVLDSDLAGPVNMTAPAPVTNAEFTAALGRVLRRPMVMWIPRWVVKVVLGSELADAPGPPPRIRLRVQTRGGGGRTSGGDRLTRHASRPPLAPCARLRRWCWAPWHRRVPV